MMREFCSTVPEVVGHIQVVVVDTRIDDGHHNAFTRVAQVPHLVGTDLGDVWGNLARGRGGSSLFPIGNPIALNVITDDLDIVATRQIGDGRLIGRKAQSVSHPKDGRLGGHVVTTHFVQRTSQVELRGLGKGLQLVDDKLAAFGTRGEIVGLTVHLSPVVLRLHNDDDIDFLVIVAAGHLLAQQRVNDSLGIA